MEQVKSPILKLKTRTLLTFQTKSVNNGTQYLDTDPTSSTLPTITGIISGTYNQQSQKKG